MVMYIGRVRPPLTPIGPCKLRPGPLQSDSQPVPVVTKKVDIRSVADSG